MFSENEIKQLIDHFDSFVFPVTVTDKLIKEACQELNLDDNRYVSSDEISDIQALLDANTQLPF